MNQNEFYGWVVGTLAFCGLWVVFKLAVFAYEFGREE